MSNDDVDGISESFQQIDSVNVLDVIGVDKAEYQHYCHPTLYYDWEIKIAIPCLIEAGYRIDEIMFRTLEGDSFVRGILVTKDGKQLMAWYG